MPTPPPPFTPERTPKSDHLSVRPPGAGPVEVHFQFEQQQKRIGGALGMSVLSHGAFVLAMFLFIRFAPESVTTAVLPDHLPDLVWLAQPGPGGGGGGGNRAPEPPKKAEAPGKEKISVPVAKEPEPTPKPVEEPPPVPELNIPVQTSAAATVASPGVLESGAASASTGSGTGSGAGSGTGSGLGPGTGGGFGGGAYRPGNGVEIPQLVRQVKPSYTSEAMRAKVQGVVLLECVVQTDGSVGNCAVQRSLDQAFGLDQEAIKAARQWQFRPGKRLGEPVPVLVTIELTFTLR